MRAKRVARLGGAWSCAVLALLAVGPTARADAPRVTALDQPALREVLNMVHGFVAAEVIVERVRRMPEVPRLSDGDIAALAQEEVPDRVVLELLRKRKAADACAPRTGATSAIARPPETKTDTRELLKHASVAEVLQRLDEGQSSQLVIERIHQLRRMPILDDDALRKLTSKGIPDRVLLEMVRKQSVPPDCEVPCAALLTAASAPAGASSEPLVRETIRMSESGMVVEEIEDCVRRLPSAPALDDSALAKLRALGISESTLVDLTRKAAAPVAPAPPPLAAVEAQAAQPSQPEATSEAGKAKPKRASKKPPAQAAMVSVPPSDRSGSGRIRVVVETSLPVTYLNVRLDRTSVASQGEIHEGRVTGGWQLPPPPVLDLKGGAVVFERELPPGRYELATAFGLSKVVKVGWDPATQAWGERYDTALAGPEPPQGDMPVCAIRDGETCTVHARLVKRGDGYAVSYQSKVR